MRKVTKKDLQYQINGLAAEASIRHNSIMRIHRALASIGVDIFSDDFDLTEPEPQPQLKQLDQSVFDGLDEKWRFAAVNAAGRLMYSKTRMVHDKKYWWASSKSSDLSSGTDGYDTSNWQNSLIERDTAKELTGSELCKAMLERGDKRIMCVTLSGYAMVITGFDSDKFVDSRGVKWGNAAPINNQGEPLTASEVGL